MESKKVLFFNRLSFIIFLFTIFLTLFFFIPYVPITLEASKGFLISIGVFLSVLFWLISCLGEGKFTIPKDRLILFAGIIPLIFLFSSFFSSSFYVSFLGNGFEVGTFGSMLVLFLIFFLSANYFQTEKRLWYLFGSLFLGALILAVFELFNLFVGFGRFSTGFLNGISAGNLVGSWNDFALLFGIFILLSVYTIELLRINKIFLIIQYFLFIVGMFFLIIINIPIAWLLVGFFSLIIFVYSISLQRTEVKIIQGENERKKFPFASLIIIFISLLFLIGNNTVGSFISKYANLSNYNVRPSIVATSEIALKSIKHNPFLGTGPNTFIIDWSLWQPKEIAQNIFWNVDFTSGFSLFTTFLVTTGILGFLSFLLFLIVFIIRGIQSLRIALNDRLSNYFIVTTFMISIYSWICFIFYNPNIIILIFIFLFSGVLIGILTYKKVIVLKVFSFLDDPRHSFFSILSLVILMAGVIIMIYIYTTKFVSVIYYSKGINSSGNTIEILTNSERMFLKAIALDRNDAYYRLLSQVYISQISVLIEENTLSEDILKSNLQKLIDLAQNNAILAVNQNPRYYQNYINLGNIYAALVPLSVSNSYENTLIAYSKAQELAPNNALILLLKAQLEFVNKNNSNARDYIKQALSLKSNYTDAIFLLVQIETNEGNLTEAIKQAELAGVLSPNDSTVFFRLGLLKYNNSNYSGAISAFEKSVILNGNYLNARYFLGLSYQKLGRTKDALIQFELLNKLVPDNKDIKDAIKSISQPSITPKEEIESSTSIKTLNEIVKPPLEEE